MRPYSLDLRERVAAAVDDDEDSIRETARTFRVSTSFIVRFSSGGAPRERSNPNRTAVVGLPPWAPTIANVSPN